jgi:hypothetical protein
VAVPAGVAAAFEVVQAEAVFEFAVVVLDTPADLGQAHEVAQACGSGQVREPVARGLEAHMSAGRAEKPPAREAAQSLLKPERPIRQRALQPRGAARRKRPALPAAVSSPELQREPEIGGVRRRSSCRHHHPPVRKDHERASSDGKLANGPD